MRYLVSGSLILAGIIHLLPLAGVLGNERLAVLYGIETSDPNLSILLRHRAVLFGLWRISVVADSGRGGRPPRSWRRWSAWCRSCCWPGRRAVTTH